MMTMQDTGDGERCCQNAGYVGDSGEVEHDDECW
jgi:hypothetical protein